MHAIGSIVFIIFVTSMQMPCVATEPTTSSTNTLEEVKAKGSLQSIYRKLIPQPESLETPLANLKAYRQDVKPKLEKACHDCHGSDTAEGDFRIDLLDPDLIRGGDVKTWLKVSAAISNGEMPPEDGPELVDQDRNSIIEWLSSEIQIASQVRRAEQGHSSFRRMTRYEYNYALQDLLGIELEFAKNLPPESASADGFKNSSELLQMTGSQYDTYLELNRNALNRVTVRGERPEALYWGVSAERAAVPKFR